MSLEFEKKKKKEVKYIKRKKYKKRWRDGIWVKLLDWVLMVKVGTLRSFRLPFFVCLASFPETKSSLAINIGENCPKTKLGYREKQHCLQQVA